MHHSWPQRIIKCLGLSRLTNLQYRFSFFNLLLWSGEKMPHFLSFPSIFRDKIMTATITRRSEINLLIQRIPHGFLWLGNLLYNEWNLFIFLDPFNSFLIMFHVCLRQLQFSIFLKLLSLSLGLL